jgi:hypothetical protein
MSKGTTKEGRKKDRKLKEPLSAAANAEAQRLPLGPGARS